MSVFSETTTVSNLAYLKAFSFIENLQFSDALDRQPPHLKHSGVQKLMQKSAIAAIMGPELIPSHESIAFLKTQRQASFFAAGIADGAFWRVPFDLKPTASTSIILGDVLEFGKSIPVSSFDIDARSLGRRHAYAMTVVTRDLIKQGGVDAVNTLNSLLGDACASAVDETVIDDVEAHGGTVSFLSSNTTPAGFLADFRKMLDHVNVRGSGPLYWVASRTAANRLNGDSTLLQGTGVQGGEILGLPLIVSDGVIDDSSGGKLILIDAGKIAANIENIKIDASENTSLQMSSVPNDGPDEMVSMFQTNSVAIRSSMTFGFELMGGFRAASLTGIE